MNTRQSGRFLVVYRTAGNGDDGKSSGVELYRTRDEQAANDAVELLNSLEGEMVQSTGGYPGGAFVIAVENVPVLESAACLEDARELRAELMERDEVGG